MLEYHICHNLSPGSRSNGYSRPMKVFKDPLTYYHKHIHKLLWKKDLLKESPTLIEIKIPNSNIRHNEISLRSLQHHK